MTLRLMHIADAHLDTPFYGRKEKLRRQLREACRQSFQNAVDKAIQREVHAVLIAGDLFDNDRLSFATEKFLLGEMARLKESGITVLYATGNHDPGHANYRAHNLDWPDNVHLFRSTSPETITISNGNGNDIGHITAAGHNSAGEDTNLAERYDSPSDDLPHIGLLHTQITSANGADRHGRYAPCTEDDLQSKGYDYWALGHIHLRQKIADEIPAWYSGNIQGRNPKETGIKGVLYVEVDGDAPPNPEFIPTSPLVWNETTISPPPSVSQFDPLANHIADDIKENINLRDGREHLIRVNLNGESSLAEQLDQQDNLAELNETVQTHLDCLWLEIRPRSLSPPIDLEKHRDSTTVLAEALDLMDQIREDDELLEQLCPEELARTDIEDEKEYLRSLLDGMDKQAASRLIPEDQR